MGTLIQVTGLRFRYPNGAEALRGIDFTLETGEAVVLLGPNGSGKTTFLLHLVGLLEGQGQIEVGGRTVEQRNLAEIRRQVGFVFQEADEQLFMPTVLEDVTYGPLNMGLSPHDAEHAAFDALALVGAGHLAERAPYRLSAGEKRRVTLAGILAMRPDILVLDEPTTSLDPPGQRELSEILASLPQAKIISTHDAAFARAVATRAVFFEQGRIVTEGSVDDVIRRLNWEAHRTKAI